MQRKLAGLLLSFLLIGLLSALITRPVWAKQGQTKPDVSKSLSDLFGKEYTILSDGNLSQQQSPNHQAKPPRPTSTPIPIPPPPDPGSINLMVFFGVIVVLIILFGVWINRQRSDTKDS